jgi:starvation-inducible DNA-binding protein
MKKVNAIGLDAQKSENLAIKLNELLANYSVFYQNTRGYHWLISGDKFFELHVKFEELYNDLFAKIDEVAERILTLGQEPSNRFSLYLNTTSIPETSSVSKGKEAVQEILSAFQVLLIMQREIMELAASANDEGTGALMSDYIREQEKLVWMYSAYLK